MLLASVSFFWNDVDLNGPNTFVCALLQDNVGGQVIWQVSTGDWVQITGTVGPAQVTFAAGLPVVNRNDGAGSAPFTVQGALPDFAWINPGEIIKVGDDLGVNGNIITPPLFTFLEPWD